MRKNITSIAAGLAGLAIAASALTACGGGEEPKKTASAKCSPAHNEWKLPVTTDNSCAYVLEAASVLTKGAASIGLTDQGIVKVHVIGVDEDEPCEGKVIYGSDTKPVRWCQKEGQLLVVDKPASNLLKQGQTDVMFAQVADAYGQQVALRRAALDKDGLLPDDRAYYAGATMANLVKRGVLTKGKADTISGKIYFTEVMRAAYDEGYVKTEADLNKAA